MKKDIHPAYNNDIKVNCTGCGMSFISGSTKQSISVHVCSKCHPFYTGEQKFIDTKGKVEKFHKKMEQSKVYAAKQAEKKEKKSKDQKETKSLRDLLAGV
jgi:large subunit ribosomal protein L31